MLAGAGPEIDQMIGFEDRLLVMLDDEDGVPEIAQALQRLEEARIVPLMEPDARLVEDVEHADEP